MRNEYTAPEVVEIGEAQKVIMGPKPGGLPDLGQEIPSSSLDLDE